MTTSNNTSANTVNILPSEKANIMKTIANIVITKAQTKVVREFTGKVKSPKKNAKGMVKRYKVSVVETGLTVVDCQATVAARKAALKELLSGKKVVINQTQIRDRQAERAQRALEIAEAQAYAKELASMVGQIRRIEEQLSVLRAAQPATRYGKARIRDAKKVNVKAPRVRTGHKPARLTVPHTPLVFTGKLAPVTVRPAADVKVSRSEAVAILRSTYAVAAPKAISTFSIIKHFETVDNLMVIALEAIATGEAFVAAAQARIANTVNTLPAVAQVMTMSLDNTLNTIHEFVSNYMVDNGITNYSQALLDSYEDICIEQAIELTDELEEAIVDMAMAGAPSKRGGDNLDKNPADDVASAPSFAPVVNQISEDNTMQSNMFNTAYSANYSEVEPLINFGPFASAIINFKGEGELFANVIADTLFNVTDEATFKAKKRKYLANITEEKLEEKWQTEAKVNARRLESRDNFLSLFGEKLGSIVPVALTYEANSYSIGINDFPRNIRALVMACFPIVKIDSKGNRTFSGREYVNGMPEMALPSNVGGFWFSILARATYQLNAEERAQFLGFMFNNVATVKGSIVKRDRISFDMMNATVTTGSRVLKANKASCFGTAGNEFVVLDGNHSIFMFALSALAGTSKQLETRVNNAVKLFQPEHNYGHKPDADDIAHFVRTNLVYANKVNLIEDDAFGLEFIGGKQSPSFLGYCLSRGIVAASDKTNIKFVTINDGAEATGLGWNRDLDRIVTPNDVNKVAKLINRGAANNYDCADLDDRVASKFGFYLNASGNVAHTKGKLMDVAFTNSKLGFGSGVGVINPETYITYYVGKKESDSFTLSIFGDMFMNHANNKNALVQVIKNKIEESKGEMFGPKSTILEVEINGVKHNLIRNSSDAANVRVVGGSVTDVANDENSIEITVNVEIVETTQWVKTRRFATKFTTIPYEVEFVGHNNHWDIILNNECTKGHGALLEMFANAAGVDYALHTAEGKLISANGDEINLYDENNAVHQWINNARKENVKVRMSIAKSTFDALVKAGNAEEGRSFFDTVEVISEGKDFNGNRFVVVEETIDVIFGQLVFDVEISTALESVSRSNLTLESAAAVSIQDRELGEALFTQSIEKTVAFQQLINAHAEEEGKVTVVNAVEEDMVAVRDAIFPNGTIGMSHRNFLATLGKFVDGDIEVIVKVGDNNWDLTLNPAVISVFGSFAAASGSSARETATVVNFLLDVFVNCKSTAGADVVNAVRSAYKKILRTAVESNKVLKKATRSGSLVYGKVRTSFHPILDSKDGIPTVVLNRNCAMVRLLGVKDWDSFINYYVGFARTPMPFLGAGRLILTDDDQVCGVAHVLVDPIVWHALNEGDSDGDGIGVMNLETIKGYKITEAKVREINNSKMGIAGYEHLYGDQIPFIDFISEADKHGKKSFRNISCLLNSQLKDPDTNEKVYITSAYLGEFASRVASHYVAAVGTAYGMCSKLVFDAADAAYGDNAKRFDALVDANLIAWRAIYEGLGLSGYSANASKFFNLLMNASNDTEYEMVWSPNANWKQTDSRFDYPKSEWVAGEQLLRDAIKEIVGVDLPMAVFAEILKSRIVTRGATKCEGFGEYKKWWRGTHMENIKFGALRRISQGSQRCGMFMGSIEEAEYGNSGQFVPKPLAIQFHQESIVDFFDNAHLGALAQAVCQFHDTLHAFKQYKRDQEVLGVTTGQ